MAITISPTLGISNQYNPAPMEQYAQIASQGLQQLGAQVQQDITTIQTNQQLRGLQSDLQGINPADTKSPAFGAQMTRAVLNNPLAAHSPVGMEAINQLGQAHQAALQSDTRMGVAGIGANARVTGAQIGADAREYGADASAGAREYGADASAGAKVYGTDQTQAGQDRRQSARFDQQNSLQAEKESAAQDLQNNAFTQRQSLEDRKASVKSSEVPMEAYKLQDGAWEAYTKAHAIYDAKSSALQQLKDSGQSVDAKTQSDYAGAKTLLDNTTERFNRAKNLVESYKAKSSEPALPSNLPVDSLGGGAAAVPIPPRSLNQSDAPPAPAEKVKVKGADGKFYLVPRANLQTAIDRGSTLAE